ncbi:MAG: MotA/TolQ/ExbB proton channel family protein [Planctomycetota bacterium]
MTFARFALVVAVALTFLGLFAVPAFAQAAPAAAEESFFQMYVRAGGWVGWIIVLCSFASLALVIENSMNIKRDKIIPPQLVDEIEGMFENEEYQEALELCESEPNYLTNMLAAALPQINHGFDVMKAAMATVNDEEAVKLQQKIGWLALIGTIAPMLGLFGTVSGMISAFNTIKIMGSAVTPAHLAKGIEEALVTTFEGLAVAIPTMVFFFLVRHRVVRVSIEISAIADDLMERFRGK